MTGNELLTWAAVALGTFLVVNYFWTLHRYPLIACRKCKGSSLRTKWIFHPPSLWFRKVGGHCGRCEGKAWTERRL